MPFKILFICGTLELSKSGVADFIHLLANELTSKGQLCACVSINDPFVSPSSDDSSISWDFNLVSIKRLSSSLTWKVRSRVLNDFVNDLSPDWISLHYVPYAFHPKGLPIGLLKCLHPVRNSAKWEIMAHELWVDPSGGPQKFLLSRIQQQIAKRLFVLLQPRLYHVTNHTYQSMLLERGIDSTILPLFSSIPFTPNFSPRVNAANKWTFVLFGAINRDWNPEPLLQQIEIARVQHGIAVCHLVSIGHVGEYGASLWKSLSSSLTYPAFNFSCLGELPAELISLQFQNADFGIAVMPSSLVGKSSSVAAMLAHGLPIIISRLSPGCDSWHQELQQCGKYILLDSKFVDNLALSKKYQPVNQLADTAMRFLSGLTIAS